MAEESNIKTTSVPVKKGRLSKIPSDVLLSPGGIVLIFFALLMEIIDWIPIPFLDQIIELPLEIIFMVLLVIIAGVPLTSLILPFIVERVPVISDILPTWILRLFF